MWTDMRGLEKFILFLIVICFKKVMILQLLLGRYVVFCLMTELCFNSFEQ